jgi:glycosyltransferase involved in cell wall biosynthesis
MYKIGIFSTFLPTQCGIATYSSDLIQNLKINSPELIIKEFELTHSEKNNSISSVIRNQHPIDYLETVEYINSSDLNLIDLQHEFKIYGAPDGENINILLDNIRKPIVTTLHTVNPNLSKKREQIFTKIVNRSELLFLFSHEAKEYIQTKFKIESSKIVVIPHGTPEIKFQLPKQNNIRNNYSSELVFISSGHMRDSKGYDMAIKALDILYKENIEFHYYIIGANHPENRNAELYRNQVIKIVDDLGLHDKVTFIKDYLALNDLVGYIQSANVCLLPYTRKEQSSSGVLALMFACGRPVVSTPFQYAISNISDKSGVISETFLENDFANAIKLLIKEKHNWAEMMRYNYNIGKSWNWRNVAKKYMLSYNKIVKDDKLQKGST